MIPEFPEKQTGGQSRPLIYNLLLMATGGFIILLLLLMMGFWRMGSRFFAEMGNMLVPSLTKPEIEARLVVINQIRSASELTTIIFNMETVVPVSQDLALGDITVGRTKLLYIARGEVRAGVDLSEIAAKDVQIVGDRLTIRLPSPRLLDSKIDVNLSSVYDYDRGFLGLGPDTGSELQTLAQRRSLVKIVDTACQNGLLEKANERAEIVINRLVNTTAYKQVSVETTPPKPGACTATDPGSV